MATVCEIVTDKIMKELENGVIPWKKPWTGTTEMAKNFVSKKEYRGINLWLLDAFYGCPYYVSFKQCADLGGQVKKGEKGQIVVFWLIKEDEKDKEKKKFILRYYRVFNLEQTTLPIPAKPEVNNFKPNERAEEIINNFKTCPPITFGGDKACYSPSLDKIKMPTKDSFTGENEYYSTFFHELTHSTGHKDRLNREEISEIALFGSAVYSKEELTAEMGSGFLCANAGIDNTLGNSASYIASWLKHLNNDKKMIFSAATKAQKAVDYILNKSYESEPAIDKKITE
jgi:antirestriction protein ArdC